MADDFRSIFQSQLDEEVDFGPVMRFSLKRGNRNILHFIFVEGSTDKQFYSNTNIETLSQHSEYFYRAMHDTEDLPEIKGKEAVFYSLKRVSENEKLSSELGRCLFVVDRDFSEHIASSKFKLRSAYYKYVAVTEGHSFENYFLEKDNVRIILQAFNADFDRFWNLFADYAGAMSPYYALNAVITENYRQLRYRKKYRSEEILAFDFSKGEDYWDGYDAMCEECQLMKRLLNRNPQYLSRVSYLEKRISLDPRFIRGHDAYRFLEEYLKQCYNVDISFSFSSFPTIWIAYTKSDRKNKVMV